MEPVAVILLSGGMDSAVTLAMARRQGFACHALTLRYGQRHAVEIEAARNVATAIGAAEHRIVDLDLRVFGGSALTADIDVPPGRTRSGADIPVTYVPARNAILLAIGACWAEALGASDVFIGVSAVDYSGYPDCRPDFLAAFETAINLGTRAGVEGRPLHVRAPLLDMSKEAIVRTGLDLGVDFGLTRSCYRPDPLGRPCRGCDACLLRAKGFRAAGAVDPLVGP